MSDAHAATFRSMITSYAAADRETMAAALAGSLVAYVTNADGGVDELWMIDALPAYSDEFWS